MGYAELLLRFLRAVILLDVFLAVAIALVSLVFGGRTMEAYGMALIRTGMLLLVFACLMVVGGFSARVQDVGAYSVTGAGNLSENLMHIAESRQSSLGCFFRLLLAGLGLLALGYLLPLVYNLIGYTSTSVH